MAPSTRSRRTRPSKRDETEAEEGDAVRATCAAQVCRSAQQIDRDVPRCEPQSKHAVLDEAGDALACLALYPNVASRKPEETQYATKCGAKCRVHPSSQNSAGVPVRSSFRASGAGPRESASTPGEQHLQ